jgi:hypothetical protein
MRRSFALAGEAFCPVILLALAIDVWRMTAVHAFDGRDQQIYAAVAHFWNNGLIPYRDVYDFKPPLIYVVMRIAFALWGYGAEGLYHIAAIACTVGVLGLYAGLRAARLPIAALVSSVALFTLLIANPFLGFMPNTEMFVAAMAALALGCAEGQHRYRWLAPVAGVAYALTALAKQPGALLGLPLLVQILWPPTSERSLRQCFVQAAWFTVGFSGVLAITIGYFAWRGALSDLYDVVISNGLWYTVRAETNPSQPFLLKLPQLLARPSAWILVRCGLSWGIPFTAGLGLLAICTVIRPRTRILTLAWVWLLVSYVTVVVGPLEPGRYMIMGFPALAFAMGVVCEMLLRPLRYGWLAAILVCLVALPNLWQTYYIPRRHLPGAPVESISETVGHAIHAAARPGDTLFLDELPFDLYLYADLPPASRILYWDAPIRTAFPDRKRAVDAKPAFVVVQQYTRDAIAAGRSEVWTAADFDATYEEWWKTPGFLVFVRRRAER